MLGGDPALAAMLCRLGADVSDAMCWMFASGPLSDGGTCSMCSAKTSARAFSASSAARSSASKARWRASVSSAWDVTTFFGFFALPVCSDTETWCSMPLLTMLGESSSFIR